MVEKPKKICRVCLNDGAVHFLFGNDKYNILKKLSTCTNQEIKDLEGYPKYICDSCKTTLDVVFHFLQTFQKSCKVLDKTELEICDTDYCCDFDSKSIAETEIQIKSDSKESIENITDDFNDLKPFMELRVNENEKKLDEKKYFKSNCDQQNTINKRANNLEKIFLNSNHCSEDENNTSSLNLNCSEVTIRRVNTQNKKIIPKSNSSTVTKNKDKGKIKKKLAKNSSIKGLTIDSINTFKYKTHENLALKDNLCDVCGKIFSSRDNLLVHKNTVHNTRSSVICNICNKKYTNKTNLIKHMKTLHSEKKFVCSVCGKKYSFRYVMIKHFKQVHEKLSKKKFNCKVCDRTYTSSNALVIHERSVHTGERPEVCKVCGAAFSVKEYLRDHFRLHTGEKPFKCPVCDMAYAQHCNMKSHLRNHKVSDIDKEILSTLRPSYLRRLKQC